MSSDKRDSILAKVQKLLAKAESTSFGAERDALLGKVDELMTEYAIAQHEVDALGRPEDRSKPELRDIPVCDSGTHLWYELTELAQECARLFDCQCVFNGLQYKGKFPIVMKTVGFPESVRAAEQLYASLKLQLASQLEPKYDADLSLEENMAQFKAAGVIWKRQHEIYVAAGVMPDETFERNIGVRFTAMYAKFCKDNGVEQVKVNPKNWQTNFAGGYVTEIRRRVFQIKEDRRKNTQDQKSDSGTSVALVLASRQDEVDAAYKEMFPRVGRGVSKGQQKLNGAARRAGGIAGKNADMGGKSVPGSRKALT